MTRVIGLGGWMTAGKDAVADRLVSEHGWEKIGMSDALLDAALVLDPWIPVRTRPVAGNPSGQQGLFVRLSDLVDHLGYVEAKRNPEVRRFLQKLGTDVGRDMISLDVWVDMVHKRILERLNSGVNVAVTGIRFLNETAMIQAISGDTIWVHRPGVTAPTSLSGHISENAVGPDEFEQIVDNDGTLEELHAKVDDIIAPTRTATKMPWFRPKLAA